MLGRNTRSGIYFQGNYELCISDSWEKKEVSYRAMGGINKSNGQTAIKGFQGKSANVNAALAPGLWQHVKVHFQAPTFDGNGNKLSNAKFVFVDLNGYRIHENISVPSPTEENMLERDVPLGPLVIRQANGPIAYRNFMVTELKVPKLSLANLSYKTYLKEFKGLEEIEDAVVSRSGTDTLLNVHLTGTEDAYGISYSGDLVVEEGDDYEINLFYTGGVLLNIDGKEVIKENAVDHQGRQQEIVRLDPGKHPLILHNIKAAPWYPPRLGLEINGSKLYGKTLHHFDSYPPNVKVVPPILLEAEGKPKLLRAFLAYNGAKPLLTHTIGVGIPDVPNYAYDLDKANLVAIWKGNYIDATNMWEGRGNGSLLPNGPLLWFPNGSPIIEKFSETEDSATSDTYPVLSSKGYEIDSENGLPVFKYAYNEIEFKDSIVPSDTSSSLVRTISFPSGLSNPIFYLIAKGAVTDYGNRIYRIENGKSNYYLKMVSEHELAPRKVGKQSAIFVNIDNEPIKYEIIW